MKNILRFCALIAANSLVSAGGYQPVPLMDNGYTTAYVSVPEGARCHLNLPDKPTVLCMLNGGRSYHLQNLNFQQALSPNDFLNAVFEKLHSETALQVKSSYPLPRITAAALQRDSQLIHLNPQQAVTYALEVIDSNLKEKGVLAMVIHNVSRRGANFTFVRSFSVSTPLSDPVSFEMLREELVRYAQSFQYDRQWAQLANVKQRQFEANLSARERAFSNTQNQIHRNNMDALDNSYNAWQSRNAASDAGQRAYVDSINETQHLYDPATGQRYEGSGYADHNYVNPNDPDMYYRSDDPNFDPNVNLNQGEDYIQLEEYNP